VNLLIPLAARPVIEMQAVSTLPAAGQIAPSTPEGHAPVPQLPDEPQPGTRLAGRRLLAARVAWAVVSLLGLISLVVLIPLLVNELSSSAAFFLDEAISPQLEQFLLVAVIVVLLLYHVVAGIVAWRRFDDWMALFVSLTLMLFGTTLVSYIAAGFPNTADPLIWRRILTSLVRSAGWACLMFFFLLFPNGRLVPREARLPAIVWATYTLSWPLFPAIDPHLSESAALFLLIDLAHV
jgi:hypothetical protein